MMQTQSQGLAQTAIDTLAKSSVRELRQIQVDESNGTLELSGSVRSYYHKQLAQETVRQIAPGRPLINRVQVHQ